MKHRELPYIKYDVNYWTAHTYMLDLRERGAWLSLMGLYTQIGALPADLDTILKLLHLNKRDGVVVQKVLDKLFVLQDVLTAEGGSKNVYVQERLQWEIDKIRVESDKQRARVGARYEVKSASVSCESEVKLERKGIDEPLEAPKHGGVVLPLEELKSSTTSTTSTTLTTNKEKLHVKRGLTGIQAVVENVYDLVERGGVLSEKQQHYYDTYHDCRVKPAGEVVYYETKPLLLATPQPHQHSAVFKPNLGWCWESDY